MSILIKGMEIPDCCTYCDYIGLNKAVECGHFTNIAGRAPDCPLVEIPPHGRLIDADALERDNKELWDCDFIHPKYCDTLQSIIGDAPTVIESEVEDECID